MIFDATLSFDPDTSIDASVIAKSLIEDNAALSDIKVIGNFKTYLHFTVMEMGVSNHLTFRRKSISFMHMYCDQD